MFFFVRAHGNDRLCLECTAVRMTMAEYCISTCICAENK